MENAERTGARLLATFERMIGRHELVKDVRGKGLMIGIEFGASLAQAEGVVGSA